MTVVVTRFLRCGIVGRRDHIIRWPLPDGAVERFGVELKVWRPGRQDPESRGLEQLSRYLERLGLDRGTLVIFDDRPDALPFTERGSRRLVEQLGRQLSVLRL